MNQILQNEITKLIKRTPSDAELQSAIKYLDDHADDQTTGEQINDILLDWMFDCLVKCANCGQYHLPEDMIPDDECNDLFCNETCLYEWKNGFTMSQLESEEYAANVLR